MNWFKFAAYGRVEELLNQLLRIWTASEPYQDDPEISKLRKKISTAYNNIWSLRDAPPNDAKLQNAFAGAGSTLYALNKKLQDKQLSGLTPELAQVPKEESGWYRWEFGEPRLGIPSHPYEIVPSGDEQKPPVVKLVGITFNQSSIGQYITQQMLGTLITQGEDAYVRGTKEAWDKFTALSKYWLHHPEKLPQLKRRLSSESDYGIVADYQQPPRKVPFSAAKGWPLSVLPINMPDKSDSVSPVDIRKVPKGKQATPGIRLQFDIRDPLLREIRDHVVSQRGDQYVRVNIPEGYFDIFVPVRTERGKQIRDMSSGKQLKNIKEKLQFWGYENTGAMSPLIEDLTLVSTAEVQKEYAEEERKKVKGIDPISTRLKENMSERRGPNVAARFGVAEDQVLTQNEFNALVEKNYPGAFGENIPEGQKDAQKYGMYFATTRKVSILADEPGAGKTCQAVVAADVARNNGQKVLVFTPNILVAENWISKDEAGNPVAKAPGQFCGHGPESIVECTTSEELMEAVTHPEVIWVVVPERALGRTGKKYHELAKTIAEVARQNIFAALIVDEVQKYKNPKGVIVSKMLAAISPYDIPHRIGLSGTPSDNAPQDIFTQLLVMRHRLLFRNSGRRNLVADMNSKGFVEQFLGGEALTKGISIPPGYRQPGNEKILEDHVNEAWGEKIDSILDWIRKLDDDRKLQILELFESTYLRRNKEDINPDTPPLSRSVHSVAAPADMQVPTMDQNWHTELLQQMAIAKAPITAQLVINFLRTNPQEKAFVVTEYPIVAEHISDVVNQAFGGNVAAAVHGDIKVNKRSVIADAFRDPNSPLRVAIYTRKLGAVGLNFDIAKKAFFNDLDWNPSNNLQAEYRVHRITSRYPVNVEYVVFDKSYDMEMYKRVFKKAQINDAVAEIIKQSSLAQTREEKLAVANRFINYLIESVLLDVNLSRAQLDKVTSQLGISFVPVESNQITASNWYGHVKYAVNLYELATRTLSRRIMQQITSGKKTIRFPVNDIPGIWDVALFVHEDADPEDYPEITMNDLSARAAYYPQRQSLGITVVLKDKLIPKLYSRLYEAIQGSIRHELEHGSDYVKDPEKMTELGTSAINPYAKDLANEARKYFLAPHEIAAKVAEIYYNAKKRRLPFIQLLEEYIKLVANYLIVARNVPKDDAIALLREFKDAALAYARQRYPSAVLEHELV